MMDKKRLRNIVRPAAREEYFSQARTCPEFQYLAELKQYGDILQIAFFPTKGLVNGCEGADARIFISADDYITQDLKTAKTKWIKGRVDCATHFEWNYRKPWLGNIGFVNEESRKLLVDRFGDTKSPGFTNPWPNLYNWQTEVLERKRKERYDRELEETEEHMRLVRELPADWYEWLDKVGRSCAPYLIYDAKSKKKDKMVFCIACQKYHVVEATEMAPRNYEKAKCPICGFQGEYRSTGRVSNHFHKDSWACYMQKVEGGFIARYFSLTFRYHFSNTEGIYTWRMDKSDYELSRDFYIGEARTEFEYRVYKELDLRWCPAIGEINCSMATVYTKNLREVFQDTPYQYCALDVYQAKSGYQKIPVYHYLNSFIRTPCLEYFVKAGLTNLTTSVVCHGQGDHIDLKAKDKRKVIDLPSAYTKQLIRLNGDKTMINLLWTFAVRHQDPPKDDFIIEWHRSFGDGNRQIRAADNAGVPLPKFLRYIQKQKKKYTADELKARGHARYYWQPRTSSEKYQRDCQNISIDWEDYIGFCRQLHVNLDDEYNLLPPDLKQAHDRLVEELQRIKDEKERRHKERMKKKIEKILRNLHTDNPYEMTYKGLCIIVPKDAADIRREGEMQHHCVATYINRVANGDTMILFIRKQSEPDEPFYTLEYRDGKVIQCRGKRNCDMTPQVEAFVKAFEKMMQRKEEDTRVRIRVEAS